MTELLHHCLLSETFTTAGWWNKNCRSKHISMDMLPCCKSLKHSYCWNFATRMVNKMWILLMH